MMAKARAAASNVLPFPGDESLLADIERVTYLFDCIDRGCKQGEAAHVKAIRQHCAEAVTLGDRIARTPARTRAGARAKARFALRWRYPVGSIVGNIQATLDDVLRVFDRV